MPTVFFLIVLPVLQGAGYLVFLLLAGAIIASYIKQCIIAYYNAKMTYMRLVFMPQKESNPLGLGQGPHS